MSNQIETLPDLSIQYLSDLEKSSIMGGIYQPLNNVLADVAQTVGVVGMTFSGGPGNLVGQIIPALGIGALWSARYVLWTIPDFSS
jgi:hypothetical protein